MKSLTAKQRSALDRFFERWRTAMKDSDNDDYRIPLYKLGAEADLSNVDVGSATGETSTHIVHVGFWVRRPDGEVPSVMTAFATL